MAWHVPVPSPADFTEVSCVSQYLKSLFYAGYMTHVRYSSQFFVARQVVIESRTFLNHVWSLGWGLGTLLWVRPFFSFAQHFF